MKNILFEMPNMTNMTFQEALLNLRLRHDERMKEWWDAAKRAEDEFIKTCPTNAQSSKKVG